MLGAYGSGFRGTLVNISPGRDVRTVITVIAASRRITMSNLMLQVLFCRRHPEANMRAS